MHQQQTSRRRVFIVLLLLVAFLYVRIVTEPILELNRNGHSFSMNGLLLLLLIIAATRIFRRRRPRSL